MKYGITTLSIVPVRAEASERSEMMTQLLFGDYFEIIDFKGSWYKIKNQYDGYIGWIDQKLCEPISKRYFNSLQNQDLFTLRESFKSISSVKLGEQVILAGSNIPNYKGKMGFRAYHTNYRIHGRPLVPDLSDPRKEFVALAKQFLNAPYLWGGRTIFGIDCSGFTQLIYKLINIKIPRDASQQVEYGSTIDFVNEANPGDLAFFDNDEGEIIHVGIVLDAGRIIHASGKVRIDLIDHAGICNIDTGKYTHQLRVVKNIIDHPHENEEKIIQTALF